ncbi:MAG: phosphoadenylyl-sulfate reductase [Ferruginibacter sp.]|nr:phosphoadenylyl-sulfate reductase [Ferruginibacter sp.]
MQNELINNIVAIIDPLNIKDSILKLCKTHPGRVTFSTSFSKEDQAISHIIFSNNLPVEVFTLDTGRHFSETYITWDNTIEKYKKEIIPYYPDAVSLQKFVAANGPNSFFDAVENRKKCCYIRKVVPLQQALANKDIWITGIRAEHSANRHDMPAIEYDAANNIVKYHPLLHWTTEDVAAFIKENNVPYNPLQDKGFVSIGCQPCTRAIKPGEDFRAGRWWWEESNKKECGLHVHQ